VLSLEQLIPDISVLLDLAPDDLAPYVLKVAHAQEQNGSFHPDMLSTTGFGPDVARPQMPLYGGQRSPDVASAIEEALQWLEHAGLVVGVGGSNRGNGSMRLTRRGQRLLRTGSFEAFRQAAEFPRTLLHPIIASRCWASLARGDLDQAVFAAFRTVEEAVRIAGGFGPDDYGSTMLRAAFGSKGTLTIHEHPSAEREAMAHLFVGAYGANKNPRSHRKMPTIEPREAQELVLLASHLLRIVESRGDITGLT
jgi:uncharacterized protein (TIGR02391 family)